MTDSQIQDLINEFKDVYQSTREDGYSLESILWHSYGSTFKKDLKDELWNKMGTKLWSQLWCSLGTYLVGQLRRDLA